MPDVMSENYVTLLLPEFLRHHINFCMVLTVELLSPEIKGTSKTKLLCILFKNRSMHTHYTFKESPHSNFKLSFLFHFVKCIFNQILAEISTYLTKKTDFAFNTLVVQKSSVILCIFMRSRIAMET